MSHATRGEYTITTDRHRLDLEAIHGFLTNSYWSPGVPIEIVGAAVSTLPNMAITKLRHSARKPALNPNMGSR